MNHSSDSSLISSSISPLKSPLTDGANYDGKMTKFSDLEPELDVKKIDSRDQPLKVMLTLPELPVLPGLNLKSPGSVHSPASLNNSSQRSLELYSSKVSKKKIPFPFHKDSVSHQKNYSYPSHTAYEAFKSYYANYLAACPDDVIVQRFQEILQLLNFDSQVSETSDFKSLSYSRIVQCVSKIIQCDQVSLFLISESCDFLTCVYSLNNLFHNITCPINSGFVGHVATYGLPLFVDNAHLDSRYSDIFDKIAQEVTRRIMCVPVYDPSSGHLVGVLEALCYSNCHVPQSFKMEDLTTFTFISVLSGNIVSQAILFNETVTSRYHMEVLLYIQKQLNNESEPNKVISNIFEAAYSLVKAENILLFLVDSAREELVCKVSKVSVGLRLPLSHGIIANVANTRQKFKSNNVSQNNSFDKSLDDKFGIVTRSTIIIPICDQSGKCVAVIQANNKSDGAFTEMDEILLDSMGSAAGLILRKAQLCESAAAGQRKTQAMLRLVKSDFQFSSLSAEASKNCNVRPENESQSILVALWDHIIGIAHDLVDAEVILLYMVDSNSNELWTIRNRSYAPSIPIPPKSRKRSTIDSSQAMLAAAENSSSSFLEVSSPKGFSLEVLNSLKDTNVSKRSSTFSRTPANSGKSSELPKSPKNNKTPSIGKSPLIGNFSASNTPNIARVSILANPGDEFSNSVDESEFFITYSNEIGISGFVARSGIYVNVAKAYDDDRHDPGIYDFPNRFYTNALLCIPIKDLEGSTIAVLELRNKKSDNLVFTDDDVDIMNAFCVETGNILRVYINEVTLQRVAAGNDHHVQSLMESYMNVPSVHRRSFTLSNPLDLEKTEKKASFESISTSKTNSHLIIPHDSHSKIKRFSVSTIENTDNSVALPTTRTSFYMDYDSALLLSNYWFIQPPSAYLESNPMYTSGCLILNSLEFNVFDYNHETLVRFAFKILDDIGTSQITNVSQQELFNFVVAVSCKYRDNPFHNWKHGFSVLQYIYWGLQNGGFQTSLNKLDIIGLCVAGLCHDLDHPGRNNQFEINTQSALALQYNDESVLENYHAFMTFTTLKKQGCNIFSKLDSEEWKYVRKVIVTSIIATDMTKHFALCKKIDALYGNNSSNAVFSPSTSLRKSGHHFFKKEDIEAAGKVETIFDVNSVDDRQLLCETMVHAADLSGQVYKLESVIEEWEKRISTEFMLQAQEEKAINITPATFMENLDNAQHRARMQVNFIDFVLTPLWKSVVRIFPQMRVCFENLLNSRKFYQGHINRFEQERDSLVVSADSTSKNISDKDYMHSPVLKCDKQVVAPIPTVAGSNKLLERMASLHEYSFRKVENVISDSPPSPLREYSIPKNENVVPDAPASPPTPLISYFTLNSTVSAKTGRL